MPARKKRLTVRVTRVSLRDASDIPPARRTQTTAAASARPVARRSRRGPRESIANALLENLPNRNGAVGQMHPGGADPHAPDTKLPPTYQESPVRTPPTRRRSRR